MLQRHWRTYRVQYMLLKQNCVSMLEDGGDGGQPIALLQLLLTNPSHVTGVVGSNSGSIFRNSDEVAPYEVCKKDWKS